MPFPALPAPCWVLLLGDDSEVHGEAGDARILRAVAEVWAAHPDREPPIPLAPVEPCLTVVCRCCGVVLGLGEHFVDLADALDAAEGEGWWVDVCPVCQPARVG